MNREPSTAADYAAIEAASEWAEHGDEGHDDQPTLAEIEADERNPVTFASTFGPNDHTCTKHPRLTCHVCQRAGVYG